MLQQSLHNFISQPFGNMNQMVFLI